MQDLWWLSGKEPACNAGAAGDLGLIPGSGRYSGGGHDNPVQCSCLENKLIDGLGFYVTLTSSQQVLRKDISVLPFHF